MSPQPAAVLARSGLNIDADIEAGIAGMRARNEAELLGMAAPTLDNNPRLIDPGRSLTPDQVREIGSRERRGVVTVEQIISEEGGSGDSGIVGYNRNNQPIYGNGVIAGRGQMTRIGDASGLYYDEAQVPNGAVLSPYQDESGVKAWGYELDGEMRYIQMTPSGEGGAGSADAALMATGGALALARNSGAVAYSALTAAERRNVAWAAAGAVGTTVGLWLRQQTRSNYVSDGTSAPWTTDTPNNGPIVSPPYITPNNGPIGPMILTTPNLGPAGPTILTTPNSGPVGPTLLGTPIDSGVDAGLVMLNESAPRPLSEIGFQARDFQITDAMNDKTFTKLVKSVGQNGFENPTIKYTIVDNAPFIVVGNNRFLAAQLLGRVSELRFQRVDFPVEGTNFTTAQDVLDTVGTVKPPKYRGR